MTTNATPSIDWTTYGAAVATGLRRYRDGRLPMNPAIQAVRDGDAIRFEFGADTTLVPDHRVVWEARNFDAASYEPNEPLDALTDDDLAQIEAWYSDPRNFDGHRIEEEIVEAIETPYEALSPYDRGAADYWNGVEDVDENPYEPGTEEHDSWFAGYQDALGADDEGHLRWQG